MVKVNSDDFDFKPLVTQHSMEADYLYQFNIRRPAEYERNVRSLDMDKQV